MTMMSLAPERTKRLRCRGLFTFARVRLELKTADVRQVAGIEPRPKAPCSASMNAATPLVSALRDRIRRIEGRRLPGLGP